MACLHSKSPAAEPVISEFKTCSYDKQNITCTAAKDNHLRTADCHGRCADPDLFIGTLSKTAIHGGAGTMSTFTERRVVDSQDQCFAVACTAVFFYGVQCFHKPVFLRLTDIRSGNKTRAFTDIGV